MKQIRYTQIRVVHESDPQAFQDEFNHAQIELKSKKPEVLKMDITSDGMVAIIQYEVETEEPENAKDEVSLMGVHLTCGNCPRFEPMRNKDGSVNRTAKRGKCFLEPYTTCETDVVHCEWFCKKYLKGEIEVRSEIK